MSSQDPGQVDPPADERPRMPAPQAGQAGLLPSSASPDGFPAGDNSQRIAAEQSSRIDAADSKPSGEVGA